MQVMPIDLTAITAIVMGCLMVLIPVAGLTARFALKPVVESFSQLFQSKGVEEKLAITERRVALLESHIESLEEDVRRLSEGQAFDRQLKAGGADPGAVERPATP